MSRHEVVGLPVVPAARPATSDQGQGRKRPRRTHLPQSAAGSDGDPNRPQGRADILPGIQPQSAAGSGSEGRPRVLAGLPGIGDHGRRVSFVHRGSHDDGEGVVPPALQEALSNMSEILSQDFCIAKAKQFLQSRRKNRRINAARFLANIWQDVCPPHVSSVDGIIAHLCGMKPRTVQCTLQAMRKRGGQAARPGGGGGRRPRRSAAGSEVGQGSAKGSEVGDLEESLPDVNRLGEELSAVGPNFNIGMDMRRIGIMLGALVACLGLMLDVSFFR